MGEIFHSIFVQPILNTLVGFYKLFTVVGLPGAFGFAIIAITILVRLVLHPFFKKQMDLTAKMADMKPHLDKLSKKHKNDPKTLQSEQMKLYKEMGVNPAAGCLFAIVQIPLFIGLYQTLQIFLTPAKGAKIVDRINSDLYAPFLKIQSIDPYFFGLNLAHSPAQGGNPLFYLVPVITGLLQYLQTKITLPATPAKTVEDKDKLVKKGEEGKKQESSTGEEFQKAMNTQMKYFFPVMIGYFAYTLPIGLSLYWNIFSIFSIIQHMHINKGKKAAKSNELTVKNSDKKSK